MRKITRKKINELMATKVMGWRSMGDSWAYGSTLDTRVHKKASWNPAERWTHVGEAIEQAGKLNLTKKGADWTATIKRTGAEARRPTLAICRALLSSVGVRV